MAKIIFFGSIKGGVGKSTLAAQFAVYLSQSYKVGVLDCDPQQTLNKWVIRRLEAGDKFNSENLELLPNLSVLQKQLRKFDYVVIDSAGVDSSIGREVLRFADFCISPLKPSQADFDTLLDHNEIVQDIKTKFNQDLKSYYLLNMCSTHSKDKERPETFDLLHYLESQQQINSNVLDKAIFDRKILRSTFSEGATCFDEKANKSRDEIKAVIDEILGSE
ncbi:TPA: ParA family protein [Haemophilus influenzae]|uniref:ParA family protein n=1 Tax=Haemophilus influenzae TaxID=727 RepID=UPI000DD3F020|nr:ParA family protein [Haemophilus influenzae]